MYMYIQHVRAHGAGMSDQPGTCAVIPDVQHELRLEETRPKHVLLLENPFKDTRLLYVDQEEWVLLEAA